MTNDRLAQLEARSDLRTAELAEIREALAVLESQQGEATRQYHRLETAVGALQSVRPPGIVALWGPTLATAIALASLFVFVLNKSVDTVSHDTAALDRRMDVSDAKLGLVESRQFEIKSQLTRVDAEGEAVQRLVEDIDRFGSRKSGERKE